ncbi:MAG: hypothetical protein K2X08_07970, partial [Chlamydiales bacterium]|nr:hypothetical protein [Chlamydiales bacterium]
MDISSNIKSKANHIYYGGNLVARKTFVIDTNVLVHDPASIKKFKDNDVLIPLIVLEEL